MGFFQDAISVFKKRNLTFIEKCKESVDVYSFIFETEKDLTWKAGQYGSFTIIHKKIKNNTRPFTVASAPSENVVRLTTWISESPSNFKKVLLELNKGMKIRIAGPLGNFYLKDHSPTLLIAGRLPVKK